MSMAASDCIPGDAELCDAVAAIRIAQPEIGIKALTRKVSDNHKEWTGLHTKMIREVMARTAPAVPQPAEAPPTAAESPEILIDDVCRGVLAAWELRQPSFNLTYTGSDFSATTYKVLQEEHGAFAAQAL